MSPIAVSAQDTCYRLTTADNKRAVLDTEGSLVATDPFNFFDADSALAYYLITKKPKKNLLFLFLSEDVVY